MNLPDPSWTRFSARLPTHRDANADGDVNALETNGRTRPVMWNWVPSAELWHANGFIAWKKRHDS